MKVKVDGAMLRPICGAYIIPGSEEKPSVRLTSSSKQRPLNNKLS